MALNHTYTNARVAETYGQITVKNPIGSGGPGICFRRRIYKCLRIILFNQMKGASI